MTTSKLLQSKERLVHYAIGHANRWVAFDAAPTGKRVYLGFFPKTVSQKLPTHYAKEDLDLVDQRLSSVFDHHSRLNLQKHLTGERVRDTLSYWRDAPLVVQSAAGVHEVKHVVHFAPAINGGMDLGFKKYLLHSTDDGIAFCKGEKSLMLHLDEATLDAWLPQWRTLVNVGETFGMVHEELARYVLPTAQGQQPGQNAGVSMPPGALLPELEC